MSMDGQTDRRTQADRWTDMTKLKVAVRNSEKAPETSSRTGHRYLIDLSGNYFCAHFTAYIYIYIYMCVCVCVCVCVCARARVSHLNVLVDDDSKFRSERH